MDFFTINFVIFSVLVAAVLSLITNSRIKFNLLLIASLGYLTFWSWQAVLLVVGNSLLVAGLAKKIYKNKFILFLGIVIQVSLIVSSRLLFEFKSNEIYQAFIFNSIWFIGVSYYSLQNISYLVDSYFEKDNELSWKEILISNIYFPKLLVGPIEKPRILSSKIMNPKNIDIWRSLYLISLGVFKRLVISVRIMSFYQQMRESYPEGTPMFVYWTIAVLGYVTLYVDFSAYMNIGQGVSLLFGIELEENFNRPYMSASPVEYWKRWHMTLSNWVKEYIYYPVLLKFKNINLAIFVSFMLVGAWHGFKKELFFWVLSWCLYQAIYIYLKDKKIIKMSENYLIRFLYVFLNFNIVAFIGLYSYYLMFFKFEKPIWNVFLDAQGAFLYRENYLLGVFILILLVLENINSKIKSDLFYINASVFLVFLNAVYMFSSSYLFYYMRI